MTLKQENDLKKVLKQILLDYGRINLGVGSEKRFLAFVIKDRFESYLSKIESIG